MDFTKKTVDSILDVVPALARQYAIPSIMLVVGIAFVSYTVRSLLCGYIYLDIKYSFTEGNRIYRDEDPIWFWFSIILYGSLGTLSLGGGVYGFSIILSQ